MVPSVSIIVTCFNQGEYLERSVKSVLAQTFTDIECLIVDDGATDNTKEIAQRLIKLDARVSYFYKENGGVSSARNFGFKQAKGTWIQFLDSDDWIDEDKIRFQLSYIQNEKEEDYVFYSDYERVFIDQNRNIIKRQQNIVGELTRAELIERLLVPDFLADSPFPLLQQCMLMHKSIFNKKMFDEHLKALQDRDFPLDLLLAGTNFIYTPIVGAFYTKHQFNRTNNWSYMKKYYIMFYETACHKHKELIPLCQIGINFLIEESIKKKEEQNFYQLIQIINFPVFLLDKKIKINDIFWLKIAYLTRLIIPSFLLYEKYRKQQLQKIKSIFLNPISYLKRKQESY